MPESTGSRLRCAALTVALALGAGCMSPSAVQRVPRDYWPRSLTETALTTPHLSEQASAYLALRKFSDRDIRHPERILPSLRAGLVADPDRIGLISLAELAYLAAGRSKSPEQKIPYLLTSARAAFAAITDPQMGPMLNPLDPNLRFAADLYNYALSHLVDDLLSRGNGPRHATGLSMVEGPLAIVRGHGLSDAPEFTHKLVAFCYKTEALRRDNRRRGLGVPIVAARPREPIVEARGHVHPSVREADVAPATLLLRFRDPWCAAGEGLSAEAELWNPLSTPDVQIGDQHIPLEQDTSLSLALVYDKNAKYRGLLNMPRLLRGGYVSEQRGLFLLQPYNRKKIPVVFIHGLMDSPLTWVPMANALLSDPVISDRYQFFVFFYPTMNPIIQSASELRESLRALHGHQAAKGEAWDDMVLVGHSMGGLITRLLITPSAESFAALQAGGRQLGEGDPELQDYVRGLTFFEPLPFVRRAVFIGAPHRGANTAGRLAGRMGSALTSSPEYMHAFFNAKEGRMERLKRLENGVDNLKPDSLFTTALKDSAWSPKVHVHSIIGDLWRAGRTNGTDGVVAYWSSHVDGGASELIVNADHLALPKDDAAIAEVRRVLLAHLRK